MVLRKKLWQNVVKDFMQTQCYSSSADLKKLRPMILNRIQNRPKDYPIPRMIPVAQEVLMARAFLIHGISTLLKAFPVVACKFCPEVFVGEKGHLIRTCCGYKRRAKDRVHEWINGGLNDILVPGEAFHLHHMSQDVIEHHQRFDFERVPAIVELCWQAGGDPNDQNLASIESFSTDELNLLAVQTLQAWETLRTGLQKLLSVYPAKVCKYCSEVHVNPSGHKARICGVLKHESLRGAHFWKKARVDDFVHPKIVWHRRLQDPLVLVNEGRDYYGRAPVVVDLCTQAGAIVPPKYHCMMKVQGLTAPT